MHRFAVVDIEATGAQIGAGEEMIQIACVVIEESQIVHTFQTLVNPAKTISPYITDLTGISDEDVEDAPFFEEIGPLLYHMLEDSVFVAHNVAFDFNFLNEHFERMGHPMLDIPRMDTVELTQILFPTLSSYHLGDICESLDIPIENAHNALSDAEATANLWMKLIQKACQLPTHTLTQLNKYGSYLIYETGLFFEYCLSAQSGEEIDESKYIQIGQLVIRRLDITSNKQEELVQSYTDLKKEFLNQYDIRHGQLEMMDAIHDYLNHDARSHLAIEASSGIGKSIGYLLPILSARDRKPTLVSTYTTHLQEQLISESIPMLDTISQQPIRVAVLKSLRHYLSLSRLSTLLKDISLDTSSCFPLMQVLVWITETETGDLDEINRGKYAEQSFWDEIFILPGETVMPMWRAYDFANQRNVRLEQADIIITNHAYFCHHFLDLRENIGEFNIVFDEAHHLMSSMYQQFYFTYSLKDWLQCLTKIANALMIEDDMKSLMLDDFLLESTYSSRLILDTQVKLLTEMATLFQLQLKDVYRSDDQQIIEISETDWSLAMKKLTKQIYHTQEKLISEITQLIETCRYQMNDSWTMDDLSYVDQLIEVKDYLENVNQALDFLLSGRELTEAFLTYSNEQDDFSFKVYKNHFSHQWHEKFRQVNHVIYTSGTLSYENSIEYFSRLMHVVHLQLVQIDSPYNYAKQLRVYIPSVGINPKSQSKVTLAKRIATMTSLIAAGAHLKLVIMQNSHEEVSRLYEELTQLDSLNDYRIIAQNSGGFPAKIIRSYRKSKAAILIGTVDFFEGIDLPNDQLDVIILCRLPFEAPDQLYVQQRQAIAQISGDQAFYKDLLPQMIFKLKQAMGRLLRTEKDRGAMIILDERFWSADYSSQIRKSLPKDMIIQQMPCEEMKANIEDFLKR